MPSAVWLILYLELAVPAELGPTVAAWSRYPATGQDWISKWFLSAATTRLINHEGRTWEVNPLFQAWILEKEREERGASLGKKDDKNIVCFQNKNANEYKYSILSNKINLLLVDGCTMLDSSLSKAGPVLIDFGAEYCWRVIIHLRMICVSVLLNLTVLHIFPTLMHESPVKCSSCWRRRITWLQISYIRAGWREGDAREQRSTILAIWKAFGNKIRVLELKGKTRTNNIKVEEGGGVGGCDSYSQGHLSFASWSDMNE